VQSRPLTFAIVDAYQSQLPIGRHPLAALRVTLAGEDLDVNVHPAKAEVRFRDERAVARGVRHAVQAALEASRPVAWGWGASGTSGDSGEAESTADAAFASRPVSSLIPAARGRLEPPAALLPPQPTQPRFAFGSDAASQVMASAACPPTQREVLPLLRVVGQMGATYVVCEGPDGMYLLDQHAAHERVTYDRIISRDPREPARQPLLEPALAELDPLLAATLEEHREQLAGLGLEVEPFGEWAYLVRAVPAGIGGTDVAVAVRGLLEQLGNERRVTDPFGRAAATVACHASVRAGMALAMEEMRRLVEDLERTPNPRTCPHGRPTLVHLGTDAIERQVGRR
jgi:DNA mismatch repair protein MutL